MLFNSRHRDNMSHKFHARSAEKCNRRSKDFSKFNKTTNKCLNAAFTTVSDDSVDFSLISEISHEDVKTLSEEASSETLLQSDITLSKEITKEASIGSTNCIGCYELDGSMCTSMAAKSLRNAQPEVLDSHNATLQYKKLLDEMTKYVIEDYYMNTLPEDRDWRAQMLSDKNRMLFLCFCIWIIGVLAILFFSSDIHCPHNAPFPT